MIEHNPNTKKANETWSLSGDLLDDFPRLSPEQMTRGHRALGEQAAHAAAGFGILEKPDGGRAYVDLSAGDFGTEVRPRNYQKFGLPALEQTPVAPEPAKVTLETTDEGEHSLSARMGTSDAAPTHEPVYSTEGDASVRAKLTELGDEAPDPKREAEVPVGIAELLDDGSDTSESAPQATTPDATPSGRDIQALLADEEETEREAISQLETDSQGETGQETSEISAKERLDTFVHAIEEPVSVFETRLQTGFNEFTSASVNLKHAENIIAGVQWVRSQLENYMATVNRNDLSDVVSEQLNELMASPSVQAELGSGDEGAAKITELAVSIKREIADFDAARKDAGIYEQAFYDQLDTIRTPEDVDRQDMLLSLTKLKEVVGLPRALKERIELLVNEAKAAF